MIQRVHKQFVILVCECVLVCIWIITNFSSRIILSNYIARSTQQSLNENEQKQEKYTKNNNDSNISSCPTAINLSIQYQRIEFYYFNVVFLCVIIKCVCVQAMTLINTAYISIIWCCATVSIEAFNFNDPIRNTFKTFLVFRFLYLFF